jgi:hypothetical protein
LAPKECKDAVAVINCHEKFENCTAYYFTKIERNPDLYPKLLEFKSIQASQICEFSYSWTDIDGRLVEEPGWAMGRPHSGTGPWISHDFLPKTRSAEWGKRCTHRLFQRPGPRHLPPTR